MILFWLASGVFVILPAVLFRSERMMLQAGRARRRALILDGAGLTAALLLFVALPSAEPRPLATIGFGLAAFAFIAIPTWWMLTIGGVDPKWELRRLQTDAAELMARYSSPTPPEGAAVMRRIVADVTRLRTVETAELCDLLVARYNAWIEGSHRPLDQGLRSIRIYDLQRQLYGEDVRPPELDEEEATFRWRLYRVFGELVELWVAEQTPQQRSRFGKLIRALDSFRREDTVSFIEGVQSSARAWLRLHEQRAPWQAALAALAAAPAVDEARRRLWPRTSVFWGAILDENDRLELAPIGQGRSAGGDV
jgi:hypothetical protein